MDLSVEVRVNMKWQEGTELLVNGWTMGAGDEAQFVHKARVEGGNSDNNGGNIRVTYMVTPLDEDDNVVDIMNLGHPREYPMTCREHNIEEFHPVSEVGDEVDKERFSFEGPCSRCEESNAEVAFIYGRSIRYDSEYISEWGDFQCMECCFTFHERDWRSRPGWLDDKVQDEYENLPSEVKEWAEDRYSNL